MRSAQLVASSLAILCIGSTAAAAVTEPNGVMVPQGSVDPVQLSDFFASQGEAIDWKADAASKPNTFSPLCGFDATFMLHGADCPLDFAWYNETGQPPGQNDLHVIIPAGQPIGTSFSGTDIKNDPSYLGGLIGFALVGNFNQFCTQSHYSNPAWNQVCSGCNPPAPWITTLIYPSKKTPNAFYVAFEDGPTSAASFNNDGDFNDDVYLISGVTCLGGGQACDTGKPGICGPGVTQCTANGTTCQGLSSPGIEKCNGLDDDCNGQSDEGDICPNGLVCDKGTCVQSCQGGEFNCPPNKVCSADGHCVDPACKSVTCDAGKVCVAGTCKGPCDGVVCPYSQVCRVGECVDPCAGVSCGAGQVCDAGVCVAKCDCLPCAENSSCNAVSGLCVDPACVGVMCAAGKHCEAGNCVGACAGVVCPTAQMCQSGQCVPEQGSGGGGVGTTATGFEVGVGGASPGTTSGGAGGIGGSSAQSGFGGAGDDFSPVSKSACGCGVAGDSTRGEIALLGAAIALATAGRRRRARKGSRPER